MMTSVCMLMIGSTVSRITSKRDDLVRRTTWGESAVMKGIDRTVVCVHSVSLLESASHKE